MESRTDGFIYQHFEEKKRFYIQTVGLKNVYNKNTTADVFLPWGESFVMYCPYVCSSHQIQMYQKLSIKYICNCTYNNTYTTTYTYQKYV